MFIELRKQYDIHKVSKGEWHTFWCIKPRVIGRYWIWLQRAERRIIGSKTAHDTNLEYPIYEYRLIDWNIL